MQAEPKNCYADIIDAVRSFKGEAHQIKAFTDLQDRLTPEDRQNFTKTWRSKTSGSVTSSFPLTVPYFYQRDSRTGHGERMCQSSAIAMRIKQIDPSLIDGDDDYLDLVLRYGDTVSQLAHKRALSALGLKHCFRQDGTEKLLCELLDKGISVPIGILHKGPISSPSGGGHWIELIGYSDTCFFVHDPFGELDLINGGYPRRGPLDGKCVSYTRKNLMKRWLISSNSDGWLWVITQ